MGTIISARMQKATSRSFFNKSDWTPVDEPVSLKDLWAVTMPGTYKQIEGDTATVIAQEFEDGVSLRIAVPLKGGKTIDLKLSSKSDLDEGDVVSIATIKGQLLEKVGQEDIIRYDAELVK